MNEDMKNGILPPNFLNRDFKMEAIVRIHGLLEEDAPTEWVEILAVRVDTEGTFFKLLYTESQTIKEKKSFLKYNSRLLKVGDRFLTNYSSGLFTPIVF